MNTRYRGGVTHLTLTDSESVADLTQMLQRLERAGQPEIRLIATETTLSLFGSTHTPGGIGDRTPLVLVRRGVKLAEPVDQPLDVVVEIRAVLDRLARLKTIPFTFPVPPVNLTAVWAGMLPPASGWEPRGTFTQASLEQVAKEGAQRVSSLLPDSPGTPLVSKAQQQVWSHEIAPGVPAGAAFAVVALGFLGDEAPVRLFTQGTWALLSTPLGEVFTRMSF